MKNRTAAQLVQRLAGTRFADRADEIAQIARGEQALRHGMPVEVERANGRTAPNGAEYHVKIKASTETIARDAGIIPINAWERGGLRNFNNNPIILAFHSHKDPIGRSVHTEIDGDSLIEYWQFHEETETSRTMKVLYEKGFMRAASVGFLVQEFDFVDELDDKEVEALEKKYGKAALKDIYWIARKAELLETSAVPVPSDPNALAFSFAARNATAVGVDMADVLARAGIPTDRSNSMKNEQTPTPAPAQREAEVTSPAAAVTPDPIAEIRTLIESEFAKVRGEIKTATDALTARLVEVEKVRTTEASGEGERGGEGDQVQIEVADGESPEQAVARFVDEQLARLSGAPIPTKK